jgi:hypothetical protein
MWSARASALQKSNLKTFVVVEAHKIGGSCANPVRALGIAALRPKSLTFCGNAAVGWCH